MRGTGTDTAIVHDYLTQLGGAERVAGRLARLLPDARLLTSVHDRREVPLDEVGGRAWATSFLQPTAGRLPLKPLLPLLPSTLASLDVSSAELVISSSSAFAHHVRRGEGALHVCYCHTPPRFLWHPDDYFYRRSGLGRMLSPLLEHLRRLDLRAAAGVDVYIAVSEHIAARIRRVYGREAQVVHPPVDVSGFEPSHERSGRFLVVSRLVRSKRVELVVEAANRYELPLDVIGKGPELSRLRKLAGPTVCVLGWQPDRVVREAFATCEAVMIAGDEDFGLVAVEAQASGRPPVAFASGGALEVIEDGATGYLFEAQTPESVAGAMVRARGSRVETADLVASARRFDLPVFHEAFSHAIEVTRREQVADAGTGYRPPVVAGNPSP